MTSDSDGSSVAPAGYYPNPEDPGQWRYWDGETWHLPVQEVPPSASSPTPVATSSPAGRRHFEYKVLTQKDRYFGGKFNPHAVELVLNSMAAQGWRVVSVTSASFQTVVSRDRQEMVILLEREFG